MQIREGVVLALQQIRQEKLKSAFSLLGVVIGVVFLIVVVSVVEGMNRYIEEDFATQVFGVNTVQVRRIPQVQINTSVSQMREWQRRPHPTHAEAETIRRALTVPARVGVETFGSVTVRTEEGRTAEGVQLFAISEEILEIRDLRVEEGRPFSPQEAARGVPVVIMGDAAARALFPDGGAIGARVRVGNFPYRVVGVLEDQGTILGAQLNNRVIIPANSRARPALFTRNGVGGIVVQVQDPADLAVAMMEVEAAVRVARRLRPTEPNNFELQTAEESLAFWDRISTVLLVALPGLVGISLVVGGIVIMNIMLVSVMERTREIGIRMAIGAQRRDIIAQFLVESTTLSAAGAVLGVMLGGGLAVVVRTLTPLPAAVAPHWVATAVFLGMSVGIVAGVYPALKASAMDPVEALRHE
jgi:putative ABC transport system permease protein